jgi:hypothetical protein
MGAYPILTFRQCHSYCENVKNITVTVNDDVYRRARRKAAEHNTSVSRLVADYLRLLGKEDELRAERISRLEELFATQDRKRQKKGVGRLKREEIYARNVR